jgi:hypothetical protein
MKSPLLVAVFGSLLAAACSSGAPELPTAPPAAPAPAPAPAAPSLPQGAANWSGDATVLSATPGPACGWGTAPGQTRTGVGWRIVVSGHSIVLEEDMDNWPTDSVPFSGTLLGREFVAAYDNGADYLRYVCQFKGATLTGRFSDDMRSFEALETVFWGPPERETVVRRRWVGSAV